MNEQLKNFIESMGIMCETWTVIYKSFISQGMPEKDALAHTQAFMTAVIKATITNGGGK